MASTHMEIPLNEDPNQTIEIDIQVQEPNIVLDILKEEHAALRFWQQFAMYHRHNETLYKNILDEAAENMQKYDKYDGDEEKAARVYILTAIAIVYTQLAQKLTVANKKDQANEKASKYFNSAEKEEMLNEATLIARGYFFIVHGKFDKAKRNFNYLLAKEETNYANHIPALLGKACVLFNLGKYSEALDTYRRVLRVHTNCPGSVRAGIGLCLMKLKKYDRALIAFERAREVDPDNTTAIVGCALLQLNKHKEDSLRYGLRLLQTAYNIDKTDPMVALHLSDHFFHKQEYKKAHVLAQHAQRNTSQELVRAEGHYRIGRLMHVQEQHDQARRNYYAATKIYPAYTPAWFGLGEMFLSQGDSHRQQALECFEKVLSQQPESFEALKVLGSMYSRSDNEKKREKAVVYLNKVVKKNPKEGRAWIELGWLLQKTDKKGALDAYSHALDLYVALKKLNPTREIPPEILNNVACLDHQLGNSENALRGYKLALENCRKLKAKSTEDGDQAEMQFNEALSVTVRYNLARLLEETNGVIQAELFGAAKEDNGTWTAKNVYEDILSDYPEYIDCHMRLSCMDRDNGRFNQAKEHLKSAMIYKKDDPRINTLLGNMCMAKREYNPAQKNFASVLERNKDDPYCMLSQGNIWLQWAPLVGDSEKKKKYLGRALEYFRMVLKQDPKNIYAVHGIACVLASQGRLAEAKDIFIQVREAASDSPQPTLNLAHVYYEQKFYVNAIKLYENVLKRFFTSYKDTAQMAHLYSCLAKAYYKATKYKECQQNLAKALILTPQDQTIRYNIGLAQLALGKHILQSGDITMAKVHEAAQLLKEAGAMFEYLSKLQKQRFSQESAAKEHQRANEYLRQLKHHKTDAEKIEARKEKERLAVEQQRKEFLDNLAKEEKLKADQAKAAELEKVERISKFQKEVVEGKDLLKFEAPAPKQTKKQGKRKNREDDDDFLEDDVEDQNDEQPTEEKTKKKKSKKEKAPKPAAKKKKLNRERRGSDSDEDNSKYKSKAIVEDSDDDDGDVGEVEPEGVRGGNVLESDDDDEDNNKDEESDSKAPPPKPPAEVVSEPEGKMDESD
eukprot:m.95569 g.95569  ORF g.95569 m.95569 type:complete len:1076 (-) comp13500_c0_seq2:165-3392(-)